MLRILSLIIAILLVGFGIVFLFGYNSPEEYKNTISFEASYTLDMAWRQLVDVNEIPKRKSDVKSVEIIEEFGKLIAWRENLKTGGHRIYRMNQRIDNQRLILELTESSYGLSGIWVFDLSKIENHTWVVVSEESRLTDVLVRGYRTIIGRDYDLLVWEKYIKVGLVQALLTTP